MRFSYYYNLLFPSRANLQLLENRGPYQRLSLDSILASAHLFLSLSLFNRGVNVNIFWLKSINDCITYGVTKKHIYIPWYTLSNPLHIFRFLLRDNINPQKQTTVNIQHKTFKIELKESYLLIITNYTKRCKHQDSWGCALFIPFNILITPIMLCTAVDLTSFNPWTPALTPALSTSFTLYMPQHQEPMGKNKIKWK